MKQSTNKLITTCDVPPSDMLAAEDQPYDTDIGEAEDANILEPEAAFRANVCKISKYNAKKQAEEMAALINRITKTIVTNTVKGERIETSAPQGVQIIIDK